MGELEIRGAIQKTEEKFVIFCVSVGPKSANSGPSQFLHISPFHISKNIFKLTFIANANH